MGLDHGKQRIKIERLNQDGGLYLDKGEVALACTAGTPVGLKFASALASCGNATTPAESSAVANRKKKTCRGKRCRSKFTKKCPSVEDIKKKVGKEMKGGLDFKIIQIY